MEAGPAPIAGLHLVPFRDVLENVVADAHSGLQALAERLPALGDEERKRQLLLHLQATRQRLQRLHVCAQWAHKAKAVNTCREVLKAAQDHGAAFVHTADELFRLHEELRFSRAPLFDVSTALHISQTGTYRLLPRVIEDELQQPGQRLERPGELEEGARAARGRDALRRLDFLLRSKLLASELPAGLRVQRVRGGQATVAAAGGQYTAQLTLVPAPRDDVTLAKYRPPGEAEAAAAVKEEVTQPMAAADQPSTSAAAAAPAAAAAGSSAAAQQRQGADAWRWQLLSFELLPAAAAHDPPPLLPAQRTWLQQHIEQRMWAAADVEQLARLGRQAWVTVPEPPSAARQAGGAAGKTSSAPAPTASMAPSHLAAAAGTAAAAQAAAAAADDKGKAQVKEEAEEQPAAAGGEAAAAAAAAEGLQLPAHAVNPLAAMHAILCQAAGRLALFSLLLGDARQMEGGSWKGRLKLSRASSGTGLRLAYWQQLPCVSYAELQCMREGRPYQADVAAAAAAAAAAPGQGAAAGAPAQPQPQQAAAQQEQQQAPAVDVELRWDGSLAASSSPQLRHALTGQEVELALPLDSAASLDADRLLLAAAAHSAAAQLAAVQAAAQRGRRLAAAGSHAELSVGAVTAGGVGAPPASPQLLLWSAGSLQLSLSVQLRTGRLLLLAGPALLESEQGGDAAAAVAAAQQQLDAVQRDAMSQPLPAGCTRGMLAARLAGDVLARLSVRLSMRRRMDAAAAAAAGCGLQRAALPSQLLDQHFREAPPLLAPLSPNTLTLALPAFPPPHDMQRWARQQQRQQRQGAPVGSGAVRCFLLVDYGEPGEAAAAAGPAAAAAGGGGGAAGVDVAAAEAGGAAEQEAARLLLAVCACTSRGTVTRVLQVAPLPAQVLAEAQPAAGTGPAASRKRRASDAAAEAAAHEQQAAGDRDGEHAALQAAAAWCRRQAGWEALRAQLLLLPVQHAEELPLGMPQPQPQQPVIRLPKAPVLARLDAWAAGQLAAAGDGGGAPPPRPAATLRLEEGGGGAWRVDLASAYFSRLPALLARQGVRLAAPAADAQHMAAHAGGLSLRYSLAAGHSVLSAISDLIRLGMLHLCLTRLAGCMAANPLAPGAAAQAGGGGASNGGLEGGAPACDGPENGGLANGGVQADGSDGGAGCGGPVWPLPGCGSARLVEAGLTHFVLAVAPPPLPEGVAQAEQPAPVRLTVSWDNTLLGGESSSDGSSRGSAAAGAAKGTEAAQQPRSVGGPAAAAAHAQAQAQAGGLLGHIRCRVVGEPPLPEPVAAALAQQLEAGRADLFLDSLCLAAHAAAAAQQQLTPEAQRAAGLLPGALRLAGAGGGSGAAAASGSSALRLRAQLQQGERAASLCLAFCAGGYTLVQLAPGVGGAAAAAAAAWLPALWDRLAQSAPTFAPVAPDRPKASPGQAGEQQQQLRQAWVHHSGLGAALAGILQAAAGHAA